MITVAHLIEHLKTQPQNLPVVYKCHSEHCLLEIADIAVEPLCAHRPDGWVANARPDKPTQDYLVLPGN